MPTSSSSSASSSGPASKAGSPGRYAKPSDAELRAHLTPLQYKVTQNAATEPPFRNAYWDNHEAGIYVDVATGEPLFSSLDKFESGTGWPSFTKPIEPGHVDSRSDSTLGMERTEVLSRGGGSHLGHVFDDGPAPTGMRYCINSAALRFVPVARLSAEGYGDYAARFESGAAAPPPADSSNACAVPPPGERPGCTATLAIAVFARSGLDDGALGKTKGVLDVAFGRAGGERAVQVTFDPSVLSFADLLAAAGKEAHGQATVYPQDDDQRSVAKAAGAKVVDAVAFRGE